MSPPPESGKVLLIANTDWYLYNFRRSLAVRLREEGWEVVLVAPGGDYAGRLEELGFRFIPWDVSNRSKNPLTEARCLAGLLSIYRRESPDLVHHFTVKCILYGTIAAYLSGRIPVVNAVTGLGYVFTGDGLKTRALRWLLRWGYRGLFSLSRHRVIFQNASDRDLFVELGMVERDKARLIRGSGVNCSRFRPTESRVDGLEGGTLRVLFASRMLREKGVLDLVEAGRLTRERELDVEFVLAGDIYPDNPSSLTRDELSEISAEPAVEYLGHVDDMAELMAGCDVVALPSYYPEGTPRVLLEAAASGKPIITTDIPGTRGVVEDRVNGFLVPPRAPEAIADRVEWLALRPQERQRMGQAGRELILEGFSDQVVLDATLDVYRDLLGEVAEDQADDGNRR